MTTKIPHDNAGLTLRDNAGLTIEALRFAAGLACACVLWAGLGFLISNIGLAAVFLGWSLVVGPLVVFPALRLYAKLRGWVYRPDLSQRPDLCELYFRSILRQPGPAPEIWLWNSDLPAFFAYERFGLRSRQTLVLTEGWLGLDPAEKTRQWALIWDGIANQSRAQRVLRRLELHGWMGVFSLLELFAGVLKVVFELLGFRDLPSGSFWLQILGRRAFAMWFGRRADFLMAPRRIAQPVARFPKVLDSLLLGPWFRFSSPNVHPVFLVMSGEET